MQCACAILSYVVRPAVQCFSTLSHKGHDFRGKTVREHKMLDIVSSATFVCDISHSENLARYDQTCILVFM